MKWFHQLNVGARLAVSFVVMRAFMVYPGVFSIVQMAQVNQSAVDVAEYSLPSMRAVGVFKLAGGAQAASEGEWTEF